MKNTKLEEILLSFLSLFIGGSLNKLILKLKTKMKNGYEGRYLKGHGYDKSSRKIKKKS